MAPAFVASATASGVNVASVACNKPTGTLTGHVMVAEIHYPLANPASLTVVPSGWTLVDSLVAEAPGTYVYIKLVTSADSTVTSYTFGTSGFQYIDVVISTWSGVNNTTMQDATATKVTSGSTGVSTGYSSAAITTVTANARILNIIGDYSASGAHTDTAPADMTKHVEFVGSYSTANAVILSKAQAAAGSSGTEAYVTNPSGYFNVWHILTMALRASGNSYTSTPASSDRPAGIATSPKRAYRRTAASQDRPTAQVSPKRNRKGYPWAIPRPVGLATPKRATKSSPNSAGRTSASATPKLSRKGTAKSTDRPTAQVFGRRSIRVPAKSVDRPTAKTFGKRSIKVVAKSDSPSLDNSHSYRAYHITPKSVDRPSVKIRGIEAYHEYGKAVDRPSARLTGIRQRRVSAPSRARDASSSRVTLKRATQALTSQRGASQALGKRAQAWYSFAFGAGRSYSIVVAKRSILVRGKSLDRPAAKALPTRKWTSSGVATGRVSASAASVKESTYQVKGIDRPASRATPLVSKHTVCSASGRSRAKVSGRLNRHVTPKGSERTPASTRPRRGRTSAARAAYRANASVISMEGSPGRAASSSRGSAKVRAAISSRVVASASARQSSAGRARTHLFVVARSEGLSSGVYTPHVIRHARAEATPKTGSYVSPDIQKGAARSRMKIGRIVMSSR